MQSMQVQKTSRKRKHQMVQQEPQQHKKRKHQQTKVPQKVQQLQQNFNKWNALMMSLIQFFDGEYSQLQDVRLNEYDEHYYDNLLDEIFHLLQFNFNQARKGSKAYGFLLHDYLNEFLNILCECRKPVMTTFPKCENKIRLLLKSLYWRYMMKPFLFKYIEYCLDIIFQSHQSHFQSHFQSQSQQDRKQSKRMYSNLMFIITMWYLFYHKSSSEMKIFLNGAFLRYQAEHQISTAQWTKRLVIPLKKQYLKTNYIRSVMGQVVFHKILKELSNDQELKKQNQEQTRRYYQQQQGVSQEFNENIKRKMEYQKRLEQKHNRIQAELLRANQQRSKRENQRRRMQPERAPRSTQSEQAKQIRRVLEQGYKRADDAISGKFLRGYTDEEIREMHHRMVPQPIHSKRIPKPPAPAPSPQQIMNRRNPGRGI